MSLILRQLLRDPLVTRPISRAVRRRYDDDWLASDFLFPRKRLAPSYETSPLAVVEQMSREMANAMDRMQDMANDLEALDELVGRTPMEVEGAQSPRRVNWRNNETVVRRTESGGLQLALNVDGFKPEELKIKLVDDNLVVEAMSESSGEDSYHSSQFKRWFKLPEDCKLDDIKSKLTNDNKLLIDLPTSKPFVEAKARSIPIQMEKPNTAANKETNNQQQGSNSSGHKPEEVSSKNSST